MAQNDQQPSVQSDQTISNINQCYAAFTTLHKGSSPTWSQQELSAWITQQGLSFPMQYSQLQQALQAEKSSSSVSSSTSQTTPRSQTSS